MPQYTQQEQNLLNQFEAWEQDKAPVGVADLLDREKIEMARSMDLANTEANVANKTFGGPLRRQYEDASRMEIDEEAAEKGEFAGMYVGKKNIARKLGSMILQDGDEYYDYVEEGEDRILLSEDGGLTTDVQSHETGHRKHEYDGTGHSVKSHGRVYMDDLFRSRDLEHTQLSHKRGRSAQGDKDFGKDPIDALEYVHKNKDKFLEREARAAMAQDEIIPGLPKNKHDRAGRLKVYKEFYGDQLRRRQTALAYEAFKQAERADEAAQKAEIWKPGYTGFRPDTEEIEKAQKYKERITEHIRKMTVDAYYLSRKEE